MGTGLKKQINFRVDAEDYARLHEIAEVLGMDASSVLNMLLRKRLPEMLLDAADLRRSRFDAGETFDAAVLGTDDPVVAALIRNAVGMPPGQPLYNFLARKALSLSSDGDDPTGVQLERRVLAAVKVLRQQEEVAQVKRALHDLARSGSGAADAGEPTRTSRGKR